MKDHYEKIFDVVVKRGDERLRQKKIMKSRCIRAAFSIAGLCAAIIVGVGIWNNNDIGSLRNRHSDSNKIISEPSTDGTTASNTATVTEEQLISQVTETTAVTTKTQIVTSVPQSTTAATTPPEQKINITQTSPVELPIETTSTAVISDIRIYSPDKEIISSKFGEICLDDGIVYKLQNTDANASVIRTMKGKTEFTSDDKNENKRYIIDAEIYDVTMESVWDMIAVKYEGSDEIYLYYAITDDVFSLDRVNFNVPFGKYESGYVSCGIQRVNEEKIEKFLDNIILNGKNDVTGEDIQLSGKVFKINGISSDCAVAVMYNNDGEYRLFRNIIYRPDTLGQLINDMNLKNEMIINGVYVNDSFYKIEPVKVWGYLLSDEKSENCGHGVIPCDYCISIDIPTLGRRNIAINVYSDGYISTNIADSAAKFNIGTNNTQGFIDYVNKYGILIEENKSETRAESPLE